MISQYASEYLEPAIDEDHWAFEDKDKFQLAESNLIVITQAQLAESEKEEFNETIPDELEDLETFGEPPQLIVEAEAITMADGTQVDKSKLLPNLDANEEIVTPLIVWEELKFGNISEYLEELKGFDSQLDAYIVAERLYRQKDVLESAVNYVIDVLSIPEDCQDENDVKVAAQKIARYAPKWMQRHLFAYLRKGTRIDCIDEVRPTGNKYRLLSPFFEGI